MSTETQDCPWQAQPAGQRRGGSFGALGQRAAALGVLTLLLPAWLWAQDLSLQTELGVRVTQLRTRGGQRTSTLHWEPRYQLSWRGPLLGGTNTYADFGSSGGLVSDPGSWDLQQNYNLNLHATSEAMDLAVTLGRSADSFSTLLSDGGRQTFTSRTDSLTMDATLAYPGYPLLSLQHQRTRASSGSSGTVATTGTLIGGNYDLGPLRLSVDQQWQTGGGAAGYQSTQYGANFSTWLTPLTQLTAYHYGSFSKVDGQGGSSTGNLTTTARLTAQPTPFLVMDGELTYVSSEQSGFGGNVASSYTSQALTLRSDPLPGIRLDLSERGQSGRTDAAQSRTQQYTATLGITPTPDTQVLAVVSDSRFTTSGQTTGSLQRQEQLSFATPFFGATSLQASYNRSVRNSADSAHDSRSVSIGVNGELADAVRASLSYHRDRDRDRWEDSAEDRNSQSVQAQLNWMPNQDWDLTAGFDVTRARNSHTTTTIAPIVEARWNMSPTTMLTARYNLQRTSESNPPVGDTSSGSAGTSSFFSSDLTYQVSEAESIQWGYDEQHLVADGSQYQRMLEMRWVRQF